MATAMQIGNEGEGEGRQRRSRTGGCRRTHGAEPDRALARSCRTRDGYRRSRCRASAPDFGPKAARFAQGFRRGVSQAARRPRAQIGQTHRACARRRSGVGRAPRAAHPDLRRVESPGREGEHRVFAGAGRRCSALDAAKSCSAISKTWTCPSSEPCSSGWRARPNTAKSPNVAPRTRANSWRAWWKRASAGWKASAAPSRSRICRKHECRCAGCVTRWTCSSSMAFARLRRPSRRSAI